MRYQTFEEFWPFYLTQHAHPLNRALHVIGLSAGFLLLAVIIATHRWLWLPFAFGLGYGLAWVGHFFVERNRPATFEYPLYSFRGDFKMYFLTLRGQLKPELKRAGVLLR